MAIPVGSTPSLDDQEFREFQKKIEDDLNSDKFERGITPQLKNKKVFMCTNCGSKDIEFYGVTEKGLEKFECRECYYQFIVRNDGDD